MASILELAGLNGDAINSVLGKGKDRVESLGQCRATVLCTDFAALGVV